MRIRMFSVLAVVFGFFCLAGTLYAQDMKKEYLTESEADKIRDAETPSARIKLFMEFAKDRLKKFDYELHHPAPGGRHAEMLNSLLNGYAGCMDDGSDLLEVGVDRQQDIREGIKAVQATAKESLETLEKLKKDGPERDLYADTLDDAIEATQDALSDVEKAEKNLHPAPPPARPPL